MRYALVFILLASTIAFSEVVDEGRVIMLLKYEEGFSRSPYLDTEGYVTVGYGFKLHSELNQDVKDFDVTYSKEEAEAHLISIIEDLDTQLETGIHGSIYKEMDVRRKAVILSMAYQLGISGLYKFKKMWAYLDEGLYTLASYEALDSKWAKEDTPARAKRHAMILRNINNWSYYE